MIVVTKILDEGLKLLQNICSLSFTYACSNIVTLFLLYNWPRLNKHIPQISALFEVAVFPINLWLQVDLGVNWHTLEPMLTLSR
jgi:hypothetical protein